jgi:hypothetical protein
MHPGVLIASSLAAIIGLAIVAVVVSQNAQTPNVITASGSALSSVIQAAVSPVTGGSGGLLGNSTGLYSSNPLGSLLALQ